MKINKRIRVCTYRLVFVQETNIGLLPGKEMEDLSANEISQHTKTQQVQNDHAQDTFFTGCFHDGYFSFTKTNLRWSTKLMG